MEIIRNLDENDNLVEPSTCNEHMVMLNHCYINAKHPYGNIGFKLMKLGMFNSCESITSSNSNGSSGSNNDSFLILFSMETRI